MPWDRWFQLYWPQNNDLTASILSRAKAAGFDVLLLTLDTMHVGWRPKVWGGGVQLEPIADGPDSATGAKGTSAPAVNPGRFSDALFYHIRCPASGSQRGIPAHGSRVQLGGEPKPPSSLRPSYTPVHCVQVILEDPVFMTEWHKLPPKADNAPFPYDPKDIDARYLAGEPTIKKRVDLSIDFLKQINNGVFRSWEDLVFIREQWKGPLLLKGIQSVEVRRAPVDSPQ